MKDYMLSSQSRSYLSVYAQPIGDWLPERSSGEALRASDVEPAKPSPQRANRTALNLQRLTNTYSETLFLARSARAWADAITSSIFSSISPGKFSRTLVERATRPLP